MSINVPYVPTEAYDQKVWNRQIATILNRVASATNSQTPSGIIQPYGGTIEPTGWLLCDGRAVSRIDFVYLFNVIGTVYGAGDGTTTFNLPDLADKTVIGAGSIVPIGVTAGADSIIISGDNMPIHNHSIIDPGHTHVFIGAGHGHAVNDLGHTHAVADPGHTHADNIVKSDAGSEYVSASGDTGVASTVSSATTGVSVDSAATGVSIDDTTATGTNAASATGISTGDTGGGDPLNILNPVVGVNWLIKA